VSAAMPERDACLVVLGSTWSEIFGETSPDLAQYEYKLRCRIVYDDQRTTHVLIFEVSTSSGVFSKLVPKLKHIPKDKIIREEPWDRGM
jgi:hypothetical protein